MKGIDNMPSKAKSNYCPSDFKMTPEQLQAWIAKRKSCIDVFDEV